LFDTLAVSTLNYVASAPNASVWNLSNPDPFGFISQGFFTGDKHVRPSKITDGTASTFLVGERRFFKDGDASVWLGAIFRDPYVIPGRLSKPRMAVRSCSCRLGNCSTLRQVQRPLVEGP